MNVKPTSKRKNDGRDIFNNIYFPNAPGPTYKKELIIINTCSCSIPTVCSYPNTANQRNPIQRKIGDPKTPRVSDANDKTTQPATIHAKPRESKNPTNSENDKNNNKFSKQTNNPCKPC